MFITKEDLKTEMYPEVVAEITRTDDKEVETQIKAAIDFAKGFLFKYDLKALFGFGDTPPTVDDEGLKKCIKIIASYFLVRKANPNVSLKLFREDYMLMIGTKEEPGWLYEIRNGEINPDWPRRLDDPTTPEDESLLNQEVYWTSTKQRVNRF
ncbi:hypothetical protein [Riemerella anatipestifer]|uniref:hypothetical protein n=1 Tax=Riemerella anatipestifer TaxID=34085 RepID=UPI001372BA74|nr:hypothetical protein [Riemerella anatipestifer]MBT0550236.1 hypothetical protein [Riemerella anatipestifer]MBT0556960.1 hypothetical protein [Riemerella anatipestifer]MBT0560996.1 hypothetical protein [Riemerella anatipestifer]NAV17333.1 hypothetical protein [Riemerella anatipestifer]